MKFVITRNEGITLGELRKFIAQLPESLDENKIIINYLMIKDTVDDDCVKIIADEEDVRFYNHEYV